MEQKRFDSVTIIQLLMLFILFINFYLGHKSFKNQNEIEKNYDVKGLIALNIIFLIVIYYLMVKIGLKDINVYCKLLNENKFN